MKIVRTAAQFVLFDSLVAGQVFRTSEVEADRVFMRTDRGVVDLHSGQQRNDGGWDKVKLLTATVVVEE